MIIINIIVLSILAAIDAYFDTAIIQNQYYELKRYFSHLKDKVKDKPIFSFFIVLLSVGLSIFSILLEKYYYIAFLVPIACLIFTTKLKLKFTRRSTSFLITEILINIAAFIPINILLPYNYLLITLYPLVHYLLLSLAYYLELPLELIIQKKYFSQAKKKLESCSRLKIIGITGSYGKTTTKLFIKQLLSDIDPLTTPKNINTPLGICRFINENLSIFDRYFIVEIGVDKPKGMQKFKKFLKLDYAIITSVGPQHLRTFKNIENIKNEKLSISKLLKPNGTLIYNSSKINISKKLANIKYIPVNSDDYKIFNTAKEKTQIIFDQSILYVPFTSSNIIYDSYLSYIVAQLFVPKERVKMLMQSLELPERRKKIIKVEGKTIIDDSYNINLESVKDDIKLLSSYSRPYTIITAGIVETNSDKNLLESFFSLLTIADQIVMRRKLTQKEKKIVNKLKLKGKITYKKKIPDNGTILLLTSGTKTTLH